VTRVAPTAEFASTVFGSRGIDIDDPAEVFHEASRLYPNLAPGRLEASLALARSPELQQTVARSSRIHDHRPGIDLERGAMTRARLAEFFDHRHSHVSVEPRPLTLSDLGLVLEASYVATATPVGAVRRPVPSAGALYPLELYVLGLRVPAVEPTVWHYDPFRHRLETLRSFDPDDVRAAIVDPSLVETAAGVVVVTAVFWRARFKYGVRGYRFALLEAGHLVQNALLVATALGLPALPLGGFFDRKLDGLVGADGLDEASIYALLLGGRG
jgi:SagB-type dehydrogenase family enzyme